MGELIVNEESVRVNSGVVVSYYPLFCTFRIENSQLWIGIFLFATVPLIVSTGCKLRS